MTIATNLNQKVGSAGTVFKAALIGGGLAAVINLVIYFIFSALGASFVVAGAPNNPSAIAAIFASIIPALGAAVLLLILGKIAPNSAVKIFTGVAVVFLLFSFGGILGAQDTTTLIALGLMHIVAGAAIIGSLVRNGTA